METRLARRIALGLACAAALPLQWRFAWRQNAARRDLEPDPVAAWLAAVSRLPPIPETAAVSFVTTVDPAHWEARLFLTRYALAPRLVFHGRAEPWVVGHFRSAAEAEWAARAAGLSVVAATDDALFLLATPAR